MINKHHVWFERRDYRTSLDKRFRRYGGFVVPTLVEVHNELHAQVRPPLKPSPDLMRATLAHLADFDGNHEETLKRTIEYFDAYPRRNELDENTLRSLSSNLMSQCVILFESGNGNETI